MYRLYAVVVRAASGINESLCSLNAICASHKCKAITGTSKVAFIVNCESKYKSYCSTVHFRRITSIYQPTNSHIISNKTLLKHFKTLRYVSILSDHHQIALFLAKVILQYSQFNSYLQMRCCGSISCCVVEQWLGLRRMTHT